MDTTYTLKTSNITKKEFHRYLMFFTHNETEPELKKGEGGWIEDYDASFVDVRSLDAELELNGDIYVWICEQQRNYETGELDHKFIVEKYKLDRPAQKVLGQRIRIFLHDDETASYLWEPYDRLGENNRKINIKVGKVEDISILNDIKNEKTGALEKLLEYSKNKTSIYSTQIPLGHSDEITSKMGLAVGEYYYVYMEMEDEDGKYYPVEDIDLMQAYRDPNGKIWLYGYTDTNFSWGSDEVDDGKDDGKDDTVIDEPKIPQTGATALGAVIAIISIAVVVFTFGKMYSYKDIT